jgi:hypothetical protein
MCKKGLLKLGSDEVEAYLHEDIVYKEHLEQMVRSGVDNHSGT